MRKSYDDVVISLCCILLIFLDILGKVVCTACDVNRGGRLMRCWGLGGNSFRSLDTFSEGTIELMLTTHTTSALCSLLVTGRGGSDDALTTPSVWIGAYVIMIGLG